MTFPPVLLVALLAVAPSVTSARGVVPAPAVVRFGDVLPGSGALSELAARRSGGRVPDRAAVPAAALPAGALPAGALPAGALPAGALPAAADPEWAAAAPASRPRARSAPSRSQGRMPAAPRAAYRWPLAGVPVVVRRFDPPPQPWLAGHRGVDLAASPGAPVLAAGDGTIVYAGRIAGRGVVSVAHADGLRTTYEPVDPDAAVRVGQPVTAGEPLGELAAGHPGCPRPACLHWGLRRGADYLDPLALLGLGPVRLFPLDGLPAALSDGAVCAGPTGCPAVAFRTAP